MTPPDRYDAWVSSEDYRRERPEKARVIHRLCRRELEAADRIADLGSGTGIIKKELEDITGKPIVGIEMDISFVEERDRTVAGDVTRLPLADGMLDFAVLNHLYEHVDDQPALFRELYRVLAPGGSAYVSAGNRLMVVEPHYRLPFLSWLSTPLADRYLRWTGRGEAYRGIRFRTRGTLDRMIREAGLRLEDRTRRALDGMLEQTWGRGWAAAWRAVRRLPDAMVEAALRWLSPQWFLVLHRPVSHPVAAEGGGAPPAQSQPRTPARQGEPGAGGAP